MSNPVKAQSSSNPNLMMDDHVPQSVNPNPTVDVASLNTQLENKHNHAVALEDELKNVRADISTLQDQLNHAEEKLRAKEELIKVLQEEHTEATRQLAEKDVQLKEKDVQLAEMHSILHKFDPKQAPTIEGETYHLEPSRLTDKSEALINHLGFRIGNIRAAAIECKKSCDRDIDHMVRKTITLLMTQLFKHDNTLRYTTPSRGLNTKMTRFPEEISTKIANGILKLIQTSSKTYLTTSELWKRWIHNEITHVLVHSPTRKADSSLFKQINDEEYLDKLNFDKQAVEDGWYANVSSALNVTNVPAFVPTATNSGPAAFISRFISGPEPAASSPFSGFGLYASAPALFESGGNSANDEQGTSSAPNPFPGTWEQPSNQSLPVGWEMEHATREQMYHEDHNMSTMTWHHQQQQGPWNHQQQQGPWNQQQGPWNHQQQGQNDGNREQDLLLQQGNGAAGGVMMASNNPLRSLPDEWVMQPTGATTYNDRRIGGPTEDYPPPGP